MWPYFIYKQSLLICMSLLHTAGGWGPAGCLFRVLQTRLCVLGLKAEGVSCEGGTWAPTGVLPPRVWVCLCRGALGPQGTQGACPRRPRSPSELTALGSRSSAVFTAILKEMQLGFKFRAITTSRNLQVCGRVCWVSTLRLLCDAVILDPSA